VAGRPVKVTAKRVLDAFQTYYEELTGDKFYTNYGMIVMADKISEFYTMPQMMEAMNYYFSRPGKKDYYDFLNNLDKIFKALEMDVEENNWLSELERETSEVVREIIKLRRGEVD
jgi:hypothetical protein